MKYFVVMVRQSEIGGANILDAPVGMDLSETDRLLEGRPAVDVFPADAVVQLRAKKGDKLGDVLSSGQGYFVASGRMVDLLKKHATTQAEYLPFTLKNDKKKILSTDYFFVNPLIFVDALRPSQPGSALIPIPSALEKAPDLFRIKTKPEWIVISEKMIVLFQQEKITNLFLAPL